MPPFKIKARNLRTGSTLEKTFISGSQVPEARLDFHSVQYLYNDGDNYYFMDQETFDQPGIPKAILGISAGFLTEGMECKLTFYNGEPLDVELPLSVDLEGDLRRSFGPRRYRHRRDQESQDSNSAWKSRCRTSSRKAIPSASTPAPVIISPAYKMKSFGR